MADSTALRSQTVGTSPNPVSSPFDPKFLSEPLPERLYGAISRVLRLVRFPRQPRFIDLDERGLQIFCDSPTRIILFHSRQVGNVADMLSFPVLIDIFVRHFHSGYVLNQSESFEDRNGIFAAAPNIVNRCAARVLNEQVHESHNIIGMDIIPYLFAAVSENLISLFFEITPDEVTEKPMEFDSGVVRTG